MLVSDIKVGIDVAFNNCITKVLKASYNHTIDIQYGIYNEKPYQGCLTMNFKPTDDLIDWPIDFNMIPYKTPWGKVHRGYYNEIHKYDYDICCDIARVSDKYPDCLEHGIIIAGKSKGAGEAILIIPWLAQNFGNIHICGAVDPLKVCDRKFAEYLDSFGTKIFVTSYKNDIVTGSPFWFEHPVVPFQNGKRRLGLSIKDHEKATTDDDLWYDYIKTL